MNIKGCVMRKYAVVALVGLCVVLSGCGGGSGEETVPSVTTYDMSKYLFSSSDRTNTFDAYVTDSIYEPNGTVYLNNNTSTYTYVTDTEVNIKNSGDTAPLTDNTTFTLAPNDYTLTITSNTITDGAVTAARFVSVGSTWANCTVDQKIDSYTPYVGYTYNDVLKLTCDSGISYYQKNVGLVVDKVHNSNSTIFRLYLKNDV